MVHLFPEKVNITVECLVETLKPKLIISKDYFTCDSILKENYNHTLFKKHANTRLNYYCMLPLVALEFSISIIIYLKKK